MRRFYYNIEEFRPESESKLGQSQESNDEALIKILFHDFKLHSMYSKEERNSAKIDYVGHLDYQLYNWEGSQLEWIEHTLELFKKQFNISETAEHLTPNNIDEFEIIFKWLEDKLSDARNRLLTISTHQIEKIKWKGNNAQLGYLFFLLEKADFIEYPKTRGSESSSRLAEMCFEFFEIDGTIASLKKAFQPKGNKLTYANKVGFIIPDRKSLS